MSSLHMVGYVVACIKKIYCNIFLTLSQLKQAEDAFREEDEEIEEVRKEFTVRVAATEKKFQATAKVL